LISVSCTVINAAPGPELDQATRTGQQDSRSLIRGATVHFDEEQNYSFLAPLNWTPYDIQGAHGVIYVPEQDPRTRFHVEIEALPRELREREPLTEADLSALREATLQRLMALPGCEILHEDDIVKGPAVGFEFTLTFSLDGETCQRRMYVLYTDGRQFTLYGQAVPQEDYDVFDNAFNWMYRSFTFGDLRDEIPELPNDKTKDGANVAIARVLQALIESAKGILAHRWPRWVHPQQARDA
jgi:hypothetical protein